VPPYDVWYLTKISREDGRWLEIAHHLIKGGLFSISGVESSVPLTEFVDWIVILNKKKMCSTDMNRTPVHQTLSNRRADIGPTKLNFYGVFGTFVWV